MKKIALPVSCLLSLALAAAVPASAAPPPLAGVFAERQYVCKAWARYVAQPYIFRVMASSLADAERKARAGLPPDHYLDSCWSTL
ncbi:hypothetical protein [Stenotrophomonas sp. S39]|uniref:hypothetical protein n=1 Tax=Stenotrophomonas sp. S39 TaxID=2767451 RepID=UPI00190B3A16|nr:hypothetical protein [Stenotrophomonas sp. S39]MBK0054797.1 hypothetical protein [Stenotrophomonas sp. S39]